ncbi:MAG: hypothetical protein RLZZ341_2108, partial [Pseudomonadota bacterium]
GPTEAQRLQLGLAPRLAVRAAELARAAASAMLAILEIGLVFMGFSAPDREVKCEGSVG